MTTIEILRSERDAIYQEMKKVTDKSSKMYSDLLKAFDQIRSQIAAEEKAEIDLEFRNRQEEMDMRKIELDERREANKEEEAKRPFLKRPETQQTFVMAATTLAMGVLTIYGESGRVIVSKVFSLIPKLSRCSMFVMIS